ncbi:hypothetical protein RHMOL_Rhmol11G0284800 [Rhododendron molle]|uniref:Uncharacterized protein n=1 Tax=Rhododendron molle TaxID=49168 RepID=A0ACC0LYC2_RHOML|nr:hypothetical protein RHMOL_Rhmol11G0284800 [Rhododendron molle]
MGDPRGRVVVCDDRCGCPSPCPGGLACRCKYVCINAGVVLVQVVVYVMGRGDEENMEHKRCSCGEHCGCNPCTCSKTDIIITTPSSAAAAAGKAFCNCGVGCTCLTCAS